MKNLLKTFSIFSPLLFVIIFTSLAAQADESFLNEPPFDSPPVESSNPITPSVLTITDITSTSTTLSWTKNTDTGFAYYRVLRLTSLVPPVGVYVDKIYDRDRTSFSDTLPQGTTYYYQIRTYNQYYEFVRSNLLGALYVSYANITVDGSVSDWSGLNVSIQDYTGDKQPGSPSGTDISNIYLAYDNQYFYIRMDLADDPPNAQDTVYYLFSFDSQATSHSIGDRYVVSYFFPGPTQSKSILQERTSIDPHQAFTLAIEPAAAGQNTLEMRASLDKLNGGLLYFYAHSSISAGPSPAPWYDSPIARVAMKIPILPVPFYTQNISPYPSVTSTTEWSIKQYGNGGTSGFVEYNLTLNSSDNYTLIINGEDDYAADGTRATLEVRLYTPSQGVKNPNRLNTVSWPSSDNTYKNLYLNLGYLSAGNYILRLTSKADYFQDNTDAGNLDVFLDWLKIKGSTAPEIHIEAENYDKLTGGVRTTQDTKIIIQIDGYDCGREIRECGCYLTSAVMLLRYHDDGSISSARGNITPLTLNNWMKQNNGYSNGIVNPAKIAEYSFNKLAFDAKSGNYLNNFTLLDSYLEKSWPVISYEAEGRGGINIDHFLVVNGKLTSTYTVKDPAWYNTKKLDELATDKVNKIRDYGSNSDGLRLYKPSNGQPAKSITFAGHSPIEILATDPLGRKLGKDPITGTEYNEISDATYFSDSIDNAEDEFLASEEESKIIYITNPIDGQYDLKIIGTDEESYTIDSLAYDSAGQPHSQTFSGNTQPNLISEFNFNYTPDQPENIVVVPADENPPEARIYFYAITKTLKVEGVDDITPNPTVTITEIQKPKHRQEIVYEIKDESDNTLKLTFEKRGLFTVFTHGELGELKDGFGEEFERRDFLYPHFKIISTELKSLQYNNGPIIKLPKNSLNYFWLLDGAGKIRKLYQWLNVKGQFSVWAKYDSKKDETKMIISLKEDKKKIKYQLPGLAIFKLITKSGILNYEF